MHTTPPPHPTCGHPCVERRRRRRPRCRARVGVVVGASCSTPAEDQAAADGRSEATESALAALDPRPACSSSSRPPGSATHRDFAFDDTERDRRDARRLQEAQGVSDDDYEAFVARLACEPDLAALVVELNADCGGNDRRARRTGQSLTRRIPQSGPIGPGHRRNRPGGDTQSGSTRTTTRPIG